MLGHTMDELIDLIYNLFTSFDKACSNLGLYKVYTIGDCYVVMSFTDRDDRKAPEFECYDVLQLAFKMI
jgi:Adenylate and Guanylate cyclase catalytic domain